MKRIQQEFGLSYLFISHDLGVVKHMCDNIAIMYKGRFVEIGTREDIYNDPRHIYTKRLFRLFLRLMWKIENFIKRIVGKWKKSIFKTKMSITIRRDEYTIYVRLATHEVALKDRRC